MKMSFILGGVASSAVIVASAVIYFTATKEAKAAVEPKVEIVYVDRIVKVIEPQPINPVAERASEEDIYCLAQNIYFEARDQSQIGQEAVAWVTINRMISDLHPDTLCDVVWEDSAFSWTHDGKSDRPKDEAAFNEAEEIALKVINNYDPANDPTEGAIMYHADYVDPYWAEDYKKVVTIDSHIFYKEEEKGV